MTKYNAFNIKTRVFLIIASLFFIWGVFTIINTLMIPYLEQLFFSKKNISFNLANTFFGAYFIISIPAVYLINRKGYKKSIMLGLMIIASGVFLFVFAAIYISYLMFFTGLFLMAAGITVLQVAANTYILLSGDETSGINRLNLAQAINSLGYIAGIAFILLNDIRMNHSIIMTAQNIRTPYLFLGILLLLLLGLFLTNKMPGFERQLRNTGVPAMIRLPGILFGVIAIFFYVGIEIGISYYIIDVHEIAGLQDRYLPLALILYWGSMALGRFSGFFLLQKPNELIVLSFLSFLAMIAILFTIFIPSGFALWIFVSLGLLNAIMFPVIFSHSLMGFSNHINIGAGILVMGISGGAFVPKLMDIIKTNHGFQVSLLILVVSYLIILLYGWYYYRKWQTRQKPVLDYTSRQ